MGSSLTGPAAAITHETRAILQLLSLALYFEKRKQDLYSHILALAQIFFFKVGVKDFLGCFSLDGLGPAGGSNFRKLLRLKPSKTTHKRKRDLFSPPNSSKGRSASKVTQDKLPYN